MITLLTFIIVLGVLILAHEFGHFITAKRTGVKIDEFGIGFPPRLWAKKGKDDVWYSINLIPLGGFVKLKGESGQETTAPDSFAAKPLGTRALIVSAGVVMNVILAYLLFSIGFMFGLPATLDDSQLNEPQIKKIKVQIAGVVANSPAHLAGLLVGDQLVKIDQTEIKSVKEVQNYVGAHQDNELAIQFIDKQEQLKTASIKPALIENFSQQKVLGVNLVQTGIVQYNFFSSWYYGFLATANLLWQIIVAFFTLIKNLIIGLGVTVDLQGPVGVAMMTGQVVSLGWIYVLQFVALLSLNLAVINFFPFPALDGGRFLFLIIEKLRRRPTNQKIENLIHNLGFTVLIMLVLLVTYRDLVRYGGGFLEKLKGIFG